MVAPIITFVFAGIIGFLAWKTSTVEAYLPEDKPMPAAEAPADAEPEEAEAEPADEPAPAEEPADEFEEMVDPPSDDDFDAPADDDFDF